MPEMSVSEIAKITKKTPEMVRRWIHSGKLKARRPPYCRDYIIKRKDFNLFWYGNANGEQEQAGELNS